MIGAEVKAKIDFSGVIESMGAGVATGVEVNVVFDIKPGNILSALSVENAKTAKKK